MSAGPARWAPTASRRVRLVRFGLSEEYGSAQLVLWAVVILAPAVFLAAMILAGSGFTWWFLVLAPLAAAGAARPGGGGPGKRGGGVVVGVGGAGPPGVKGWSVPAAMAIATSHTALVLLGGRPASGDLAADTWVRVRRRLGVVGAITVGVAVVAQLVRSVHVPGQIALAVAALVAVSLWPWLGTRTAVRDEGSAR